MRCGRRNSRLMSRVPLPPAIACGCWASAAWLREEIADGQKQVFTFLPIKHIFAAAALADAIAWMGTAGPTQTDVIMIAIDKMPVGAAPADFEFARTGQGGPAQWMVAADATASGGRTIEQTSTDRTDYRFPLAIYQKMSAQNVDLTVHFKAVAGKVDQAGGIAVRLNDADNYY